MGHFLVTGGAGFIGSHLVVRLLAEGHRIRVVDDFSTGRRENLASFGDVVELIEGSIEHADVCRRAVHGTDVVFHLAALGSVPRSIADPLRTHEVNATGTLRLLVAAQAAGVQRFVYSASSSAYGETEALPKRESMTARPMSPYGAAKLAGEEYCRVFHETYRLPTVSLRYFNVFGPRQDPASQYAAVIPRFIAAARRGEPPTIHGDGEQTRDFTYVDNVVQANMLALEAAPAAFGCVFNVGSGTRISVNALWRKICENLHVEMAPRYDAARAGDIRHSLAAIDRAREALGYVPVVTFEEGLARTCAS